MGEAGAEHFCVYVQKDGFFDGLGLILLLLTAQANDVFLDAGLPAFLSDIGKL